MIQEYILNCMNKNDVTNKSEGPTYILGMCLFMESRVPLDMPLQR